MNPMRLFVSLFLVVSFAVSLSAQQPPPDGAKPPRRPPPEPKNLKVLKVPNTELIPAMRAFSAALGVQCVHCHVQGDFASDENPKKEIGRHMITMAIDLNSKFPDGKMHVSCFTCHRGEVTPKVLPEPKPAAAPAQ